MPETERFDPANPEVSEPSAKKRREERRSRLATEPFDAARYLDRTEDHVDLLNEALETESARVVLHVIGIIARARGLPDSAAAIADDASPTLDTLVSVLDGLGLELQVRARQQPTAS